MMQMGWRREYDDEVAVGQPLHIPKHGPMLIGGGVKAQESCDVILECHEPGSVHARLEIFWKGRKPWYAFITSMHAYTLQNSALLWCTLYVGFCLVCSIWIRASVA